MGNAWYRAAPRAWVAVLVLLLSGAVSAAELGAGVWWVYQYTLDSDFSGAPSSAFDEDLDAETGGNFANPAFVLYGNDDDSHGPWHFAAELRIGSGSFTDPSNNDSGDSLAVHQAWIGYDLDETHSLRVGKSQVPFGWKTVNFWPGDLLQGGYGDQMDVGLKLSGERGRVTYDLAYYHQDDWGENSTDTVDDNGHWGSSATYRKIKTGVANLDFRIADGHVAGISYQNGRMQELATDGANPADPRAQNDSGRHDALDMHYYLDVGRFVGKYRYIDTERDFGDMTLFQDYCSPANQDCLPAADRVRTKRHAAHLGWKQNSWYYYLEATTATTDTRNNEAGRVNAYAPGVRYQYGPGWLYLEYLWSNGDIDANGDIYEADFRTVYASFDFYF